MGMPKLKIKEMSELLNPQKDYFREAFRAAKDTITGKNVERVINRRNAFQSEMARRAANPGKYDSLNTVKRTASGSRAFDKAYQREHNMHLGANAALAGSVIYGGVTGLNQDPYAAPYAKYASSGEYVTDYPEQRANIPVDKTNIQSTDPRSTSDYYDYLEYTTTEGNIPDRQYYTTNDFVKRASIANEIIDALDASPHVHAEMYKYAHLDNLEVVKQAAKRVVNRPPAGNRLLGAAILATTGGLLAHEATRAFKNTQGQLPNYAQ